MELLLLLLERPGELVPRNELHERLWPDGTFTDFDHGLNNAVNRLRQVLADSSTAPRYVETLPRVGYRFVAPVEVLDSTAPAPPPARRYRMLGAALLLFTACVGAFTLHTTRTTSRDAAHETYVRGREELARGTADSLARARAYFQRSIALDPRSAEAHTGLAATLNRTGIFGAADPLASHRAALNAANEALRLDPRLAEAYVARATARLRLHWDWKGADADLRRAMTLDPDYVRPHQAYAFLLAARGHYDDALREIAGARQLDPLSVDIRREEAELLYLARRYEASIARLTALAAEEPRDAATRRTLADAYLHAGDDAAAQREYVKWLELLDVPASELELVRTTLARDGFPGQWRRLVTAAGKPGHSYKRATMCAAIGRTDEALTALARAFDRREGQLLYLRSDPYLDPLRGEPRFVALLARAGM
jgi:tetratricopeptide (TPR) repeat protein